MDFWKFCLSQTNRKLFDKKPTCKITFCTQHRILNKSYILRCKKSRWHGKKKMERRLNFVVWRSELFIWSVQKKMSNKILLWKKNKLFLSTFSCSPFQNFVSKFKSSFIRQLEKCYQLKGNFKKFATFSWLQLTRHNK